MLTTPMIAAFKRFFPDAHLSVLVKPEAGPLLRHHPAIDELILIDKKGAHRGPLGMWKMARALRAGGYDVLLSPHRSHRTSLLALLSGIPARYGYREAALSRLAYTRRLERPADQAEIVRLLTFLEQSLGVDCAAFPRDLELFVDDAAQAEARQLLAGLDVARPILIAPSSVWPTKRWTPYGFAQLIHQLFERYQRPLLLVGSKGDRELGDTVLEFVKLAHPDWPGRLVHNVCGTTSLGGLFALMQKSALLVSNDSAPVHFGCAAKIPVVAIFGPTVPALGYAPIAPRTAVAELADLGCRPCGTHGARKCPQTHFRCMRDLRADDVMRVVEQVMR